MTPLHCALECCFTREQRHLLVQIQNYTYQNFFLIRFDTTAIWDFSMQHVQFRVLKKSPNKKIYLIRDIKHTVKCPVVQSQFNQF